jgi:N-acetylglutamate synthase-like GNAT family acetyltransferase
MVIRVLVAEDYRQLYDLRNRVLRMPLGLSLYNEDLEREQDQIAIGAFDRKGLLLGCVMVKEKVTIAKLRQMAVEPSMQHSGIGTQLITFAENWAIENNISTIELHARGTAVPFYEQLNYKIRGDFFEEVGIPHVAMYKLLG